MTQDKRVEIAYRGPANPCVDAQPQKPLSPETARVVALSAWRLPGRLRLTDHFNMRVRQRNFDIFDVEYVIRRGTPVGNAVFCRGKGRNNYKYRFWGKIDGLGLRVVFAIDATQDYHSAPLVILITAAWDTKTGSRKR